MRTPPSCADLVVGLVRHKRKDTSQKLCNSNPSVPYAKVCKSNPSVLTWSRDLAVDQNSSCDGTRRAKDSRPNLLSLLDALRILVFWFCV